MKNSKAIIMLLVFIVAISILCITGVTYVITRLTTSPTFYKNDGGYDAAYIPLIEPYRAIKLLGGERFGNEHKWTIDLIVHPSETDLYYYSQIYDVTKISATDQVIMAYSPHSIKLTDDDKRVGQKVLHWFVIIPNQKIETGFETEEELLAYIHAFGIEKPLWIDPGLARQQFIKTGCLDWIPDCK